MLATRAAVNLLTPPVPKFVARGEHQYFLDILNADIVDFDALVTTQQTAHIQSQGTTSQIEATTEALIDAYKTSTISSKTSEKQEPGKLAQLHHAEKSCEMARNLGNAILIVVAKTAA